MKKIIAVYLSTFRAEEHYEFLIVFRDFLLKYPLVMQVVAAFYDAFTDLIKREGELINAMRKSNLTKLIADADQLIDRTITGMHQVIGAALHHFKPDVAEAARFLHNRFEAFGDITKKAYEEEITDVNFLLADLASDEYAAKATLVGLDDWTAELKAAVNDFELLIARRNTEASLKPQGRLSDVRREVDTLYRTMIERIGATALLDASGAFIAFVAELNARITYFNHHAHQHARKDIGVADDCVLEDVPEQTYTGKAVTPLPKAYYREEGKPTVELVFARDFSVTYKNNVDIGTADLTLHGKDAYKGQKKTTFNIARAK